MAFKVLGQSLTRDADAVRKVLRKLPDKRVVCTKPVKIYIPSRYAEHRLAVLGSKPRIVGICAMRFENFYMISLINAMINIEPSSVLKVDIGDEEYFEFSFDAGSCVFSAEVVKMDSLVYEIYDEIIAGGRVPHYLTYLDLAHIFDTAGPYAGADIGRNREVTELIVSMIARDSQDRSKYARQTIASLKEVETKSPFFIPLRSVQYSATNTVARINGSYMDQGMVAALVNPATRVERIEALLRA